VQISMDGKGRAYDNIFTERALRYVWTAACSRSLLWRNTINVSCHKSFDKYVGVDYNGL
jgi:hypothetical protein